MTTLGIAHDPLYFFDDSETGRLARSIDWAKHSLGDAKNWPGSLKTTLGILFRNRHPMFLFWGEDLICFYNDAYKPSFGVGKHPDAMGKRGIECWPEIWHLIGPQIEQVMTKGIGTWNVNHLVPIFRNGKIDEVYWTYSYSAVLAENGLPTGVVVTCTETTHSVVVEKQLRESERQANKSRDEILHLMMLTPFPMVILDGPNHVFRYVNAMYRSYFLADQDPAGKTVAELIPEAKTQGFVDLLDKVFRTQQRYVGSENFFELRMPDKSTKQMFLNILYEPIIGANGQSQGVLAAIMDVTEQVRARATIEKSKRMIENERENFRNLFRETPEMVCILRGPDHIFEFVNEAHVRALGFDATGKTVREAQPESVEIHGILDEVYETGQTAELFEIPVTLGRRLRHFNLTYAARRDSDGRISGVMILGTEITEQILVRDAIVSQKEALELTLHDRSISEILDVLTRMVEHQLGDGIMASALLLSEDGHHLEHGAGPNLPNEFNQAVHGIKIGTNVGSCGTAAYEKRTVIVENIETDPIWADYKDLALSYQLRACWSAPIFSSKGKVLGTFAIYCNRPRSPSVRERQLVDLVTRTAALAIERRTDVDSLKTAKIEAELANESKTRFLTNMSHEIRTPLAAISGFAELLRGRTKDADSEAERQLLRISRNATQLGRLIDDLLDLSKIEAERFEIERQDFDVFAVVEDVVSSLDLKAKEKGLTIHQKTTGAVPRFIHTDPNRLRQILVNLLSNAVKFTEKGRIDISLEIKPLDGKTLLLIQVRDTGIGISLENQKKIFTRFVQGDVSITRKYGGSGLGLVLSRRMAQLMGGYLSITDSVEGKGSTFEVMIEIEKPTNPRIAPADFTESLDLDDALKGMRILIVDDSLDNQMICRFFVEAAGAVAEIANNGMEAVECLKKNSFDAVLMDIQMPVMDGYQALKEARAFGYKKPIFAVTAHAMKQEKDACLAAGFSDYISKPINRNALIHRLAVGNG